MLSGCQTPVNPKPSLENDYEVIKVLRNILINKIDTSDAIQNKLLIY
jgi:hypothetical protein